jgi:signal transduction histidine kinase/CheY-like chemotaxis protein
MDQGSGRRWGRCALLAAVYWAAARFGLSLAVVNPSASPVWPPSAIGFVALLLWGRGLWPGVLAGAFAANLQLGLAQHVAPWAAAAAALLVAAGNALESACAAGLVERFAGGRRALESSEGVFKMALAAGASTSISATVGVATLGAFALTGPAPAALVWRDWWLGDLAGILILGPFLLAWLGEREPARAGTLETAALAAVVAGTIWASYVSGGYPLAYVVLPLVLWSTFRFGRRGSSSIVLIISAVALFRTYGGHGPFAGREGHGIALAQAFMATVALSTQALAGVLSERERVQEEILRSRDRLEEEVQVRTRELVQAQKMEAVGRLAGGVAHEFNNLLTGIMGLASLIAQQLPPEQPARADVEAVLTACRRGAGLVGRLLAFSRSADSRKELADLNDAVEDSRRMLEMALGAGVRLEAALPPGLPVVMSASSHVEQILLNLCLNARDAMGGAGRVSIATYAHRVESEQPLSHGRLKPGLYVALSVADTGPGIPEDLKPKLFEPFFTTKKAGNGLGLSIVHGIMADHGGSIDVRPGPDGRGAAFHLFFPASEARKAPPAAAAPAAPGGAETVLLADDEEFVRESLARALRAKGYRVLTAADGEEACRVFEEQGGRVDAVLLDFVMPKLGGDEAYLRLEKRRPGLKVLFMSGRVTGEAERLIRSRRLPLIAKPFEPEQLMARLRDVLDARRV